MQLVEYLEIWAGIISNTEHIFCEVSDVVQENYPSAKIWVQINVYEHIPMKILCT